MGSAACTGTDVSTNNASQALRTCDLNNGPHSRSRPPDPSPRRHPGLASKLQPGGWCRTSWLPASLGLDSYRKQAETHIDSLATRIANLQRQIEEQAGGLLDERDRLIQQRLWLQNELDNVGAG